MKKFENVKELNELEVEMVAGGDLPTIYNPGNNDYEPNVSEPVFPQFTPEPEKPEPGRTGRQASEKEEQEAALDIFFNFRFRK